MSVIRMHYKLLLETLPEAILPMPLFFMAFSTSSSLSYFPRQAALAVREVLSTPEDLLYYGYIDRARGRTAEDKNKRGRQKWELKKKLYVERRAVLFDFANYDHGRRVGCPTKVLRRHLAMVVPIVHVDEFRISTRCYSFGGVLKQEFSSPVFRCKNRATGTNPSCPVKNIDWNTNARHIWELVTIGCFLVWSALFTSRKQGRVPLFSTRSSTSSNVAFFYVGELK